MLIWVGEFYDRVITDDTMVSPLANDKGNVYKCSLKQSRSIQYRETGTRNK